MNLKRSSSSYETALPASSAPQVDSLEERPLLDVLDSYIEYYASGLDRTSKAKRRDLSALHECLAAVHGAPKVKHLTHQSIKDFIEYRLRKGFAPTTVNRELASIKHFCRTLSDRVAGFINPSREIRPIAVADRGYSCIEGNDLRKLLAASSQVGRTSETRVRNKFIMYLLSHTGLRCQEICDLKVSQVSDGFDFLIGVRCKGRKYRNIPIRGELKLVFVEYMEVRGWSGQWLITSARNPLGRVGPKTIWRVVNRVASVAGVNNVHPHKLRHTFAHTILDVTKNIRLVAHALGHSDIKTTMKYTTPTDEAVGDAIDKAFRLPE